MNPLDSPVFRWRTGWDSNPRAACATTWFRVRCASTTFQIFCVRSCQLCRAEKPHSYWIFWASHPWKRLCIGTFAKWVRITQKCDFGQNWGQTGQNKDRTAIHGQHTDNTVFLRCIANERERNQLGFYPGCYNERSALSNLPYQQINGVVSPAKRKDSVRVHGKAYPLL